MTDDTRGDAGGAFGFTCSSCGDFHVGMPSFGWEWPVQYLMVAEGERDRRVELAPDYCVIDQRWFFVRGCLDIHVHGHEEPFSWGAWVSLSEKSFQRYVEQHDDRARRPGRPVRRLALQRDSRLPGHAEPQGGASHPALARSPVHRARADGPPAGAGAAGGHHRGSGAGDRAARDAPSGGPRPAGLTLRSLDAARSEIFRSPPIVTR